MKRIFLVLFVAFLFSIFTPSIMAVMPEQIKQLQTSKKSNLFNSFIKCLNEDKNCNAQKIKLIRSAVIIASTFMLGFATGATIVYLTMRKTGVKPENQKITSPENVEIAEKTIPKDILATNTPIQPVSPISLNESPKLSPDVQEKLNEELLWWTIPRNYGNRPDQIPMLQNAIKQGAQINIKNQNGETPLILASLSGQNNVVKVLLENGANIKVTDNKGKTALDHAKSFQKMCPERYDLIIALLEEAEKKLS